MNITEYSVVVPVYNSEAVLAMLLARIDSMFKGIGQSYEVVFVEDRGGDNSWEVIKSLHERYPQTVCGVRLSRNFGQHAATLCGLQCAVGKYIITLDDDLQLPPEQIPRLIARQAQTGADCVYGVYAESHQPFIRKLGSRFMQYVVRQTFRCSVEVSSFRLLRRELVQKMIRHRQGFLFLEGLIWWHTQDVATTQVTRQKREYGQSGYNLFSLARLLLHLIFNYTMLPLRAAMLLGCFTFAIGIGLATNLLPLPLGRGMSISNLFLGSIWLMGGMITIVIGIAIAYLVRIYATQQQIPSFSIKETLPPIDG